MTIRKMLGLAVLLLVAGTAARAHSRVTVPLEVVTRSTAVRRIASVLASASRRSVGRSVAPLTPA